MGFSPPGPLKPWQFKPGARRSTPTAGGVGAGRETGVAGPRRAGCATVALGWLTSAAAGARIAPSATSTALGPAAVDTLLTLDPEIDEGAPQAAKYRLAIKTAPNFFTMRYNAGARRLSRAAAKLSSSSP
jgi:hypothetical protein